MKSTKEITTGAMLLAIFGAILLIDRQFSFAFTYILSFIVPVVIIVYGNIYSLKNGLILSISMLLISLVLSPSILSYFYIGTGLIIGNVYNLLLKKGLNSKMIFIIISILFTAIEIVDMFIMSPLFLNITFEQTVASFEEMINNFFPQSSVFNIPNLSLIKFIKIVSIASLVLTGIMEALIIRLFVLILFKRFHVNIDSRSSKNIFELSVPLSYILFIGTSLMLFYQKVDNETLASIFIIVSSICFFILAYYGYIFSLLFLRMRYQRRAVLLLVILIILLLPISLLVLMIIGFLYGSGPLKKYLIMGVNSGKN